MRNMSIKRASLIYGGAKYSTVLLNMILAAILSRLLTPNDYGIVAIVTVFTSLFSVLSNLGIGPAVIYHKEIDNDQLQEVFNFSLRMSFALSLVFAVLSIPISVIYKDSVYIPITLVLSVSVFFNAANMVPNAVLLRDKNFFTVGLRMILSTLISGIIAVVLAYSGAKYYSLVIQSVLSAFINFAWNMKGSGLRFGFSYQRKSIEIIKDYSLNQFGFNLCVYIVQNVDNMLVGAYMGNETLGYYNKGFTLSRYPVNNIGYVVTPVLQPILTDYKDDKEYLYKKFVEIFKLISLIGIPLSVISVWAGKELILCYFGNQWANAVVPFQIMSFGMWSQLVNTIFGSIYQSLGTTKQMFRSGIVFTVCTIFAVFIGIALKSIIWVAVFMTLCTYVKFASEVYFLIKKSFGFSVKDFLRNLIPELCITIAMAIVVCVIGEFHNVGLFLSLILKCIVVVFAYMIMLILTKQYKYFLPLLPNRKVHKGEIE